MSVVFDGTNHQLALADDAALALPAGDWAISAWVKFLDSTGSLFQTIFGWGSYAANPSALLRLREASNSAPLTLQAVICDAATDLNWTTAGQYGGSAWQHVLIQRATNVITIYVDGTADANTRSAAGFGAVDVAAALILGGSNSTLRGPMRLADVGKASRAFTAPEIAEIVAGKSLKWFEAELDWYCPFKTDIAEKIVPLTLTDGSGGLNADHPTISDPPTIARFPWQQRRRRRMHGVSA